MALAVKYLHARTCLRCGHVNKFITRTLRYTGLTDMSCPNCHGNYMFPVFGLRTHVAEGMPWNICSVGADYIEEGVPEYE